MRVENAVDVRGQNLNARTGLAVSHGARKEIECAEKKLNVKHLPECESRAEWNHQPEDEKMLGSKDQ